MNIKVRPGTIEDCDTIHSFISELADYLGLKEKVSDIPEVSIEKIVFPVKLFYLLSALNLYKSSSESKRSIKGGAIKIDSKKVINPDLIFDSKENLDGKILQIGKKIIKRFVM